MDTISITSPDQEKTTYAQATYSSNDDEQIVGEVDDLEVFNDTANGVSFHTVAWPHAAMIFCKILCSTGIMTIPSAMASLGAVSGALIVVGWAIFNTYSAYICGISKQRHPSVHGIADMAGMVGGPITREVANFLFALAFLLGMGSGIVGVSTAINTFSDHSACTIWWSAIATVVATLLASIRKLHQIGWLAWVGLASILAAVLTVTIAVTFRDRPAAAPQTGPFELGYYAIGHTTFSAGMVAVSNIFLGSAGHPGFIPVISEMKRSKDYNKALFWSMGSINAIYLSLSLVVYRWCGKWVASPSLGVCITQEILETRQLTSAAERWTYGSDCCVCHCASWIDYQVCSVPSRRFTVDLSIYKADVNRSVQRPFSSVFFAIQSICKQTVWYIGARG